MSAVIDRDLDVLPWLSPVCTFCRHARGFRRCAAFASDIPLEIWVGLNQHQQPVAGDHGLQFEPEPGAKVTTPQGPDWPVIRILRAEGRLAAAAPDVAAASQAVPERDRTDGLATSTRS